MPELDSTTMTRQQLYDRIWTEPISRVAESLGLSDRGLAKLCERHRIPRPGRGYWQKLKHGKRVHVATLPVLSAREQHLDSVHIERRTISRDPAEPPTPVERQKAFEAQPENRIVVPQRVGRYHRLVRETTAALTGRSRGTSASRGRVTARKLDVDVERSSLRRALRIMDTLIKALEGRSFSVRISDEAEPRTLVTVENVELPIRIEEQYRRITLPATEDDLRTQRLYGWEPLNRYEREATGRLALKISADSWDIPRVQKTWADGESQRVENLLNRVIVGLVRAAEVKKRTDDERERQRIEREERWRIAQEKHRLAELEQSRQRDLLSRASSWAEHCRVDGFVAAVRQAGNDRGLVTPGSPLEEWLAWAEGYLEQSNPLRHVDELSVRDPESRGHPLRDEQGLHAPSPSAVIRASRGVGAERPAEFPLHP